MINQSRISSTAKLGGFEIVLERLLKTARSGRGASQCTRSADLDDQRREPERGLLVGARALDDLRRAEPAGSSFFDQDLSKSRVLAVLVPVARLLRDVPSSIEVAFDAPFDEPHEFLPRAPVETDVFPEASGQRAGAPREFHRGTVRSGSGRSALARGVSTLFGAGARLASVTVNERFIDERGPGDEETYLIEHNFVDLAPLTHDAILLELPLGRCVAATVKGSVLYCGIDRNEATCECQAPIDRRGLHWRTPICGPRVRGIQRNVTVSALPVKEKIDGRSQAQDQQSQDPKPPCRQLAPGATRAQRLSSVRDLEVCPTWCARTAVGTRIASR